jgi:hypothetical protein
MARTHPLTQPPDLGESEDWRANSFRFRSHARAKRDCEAIGSDESRSLVRHAWILLERSEGSSPKARTSRRNLAFGDPVRI